MMMSSVCMRGQLTIRIRVAIMSILHTLVRFDIRIIMGFSCTHVLMVGL